MMNILYNDIYSNLMFAVNLNDESVMIIDDDLNKHFEVSFNPWEPEDEDLIKAWTQAVRKYFELDDNKDERHLGYRESMAERSINGFKQHLIEAKKPQLPDFEKTVKDLARHYVYNICENEDRLDFYNDEDYEVNQIIDYAYKWFLQNNDMVMYQIVATIMHFELEEGMSMAAVDNFQRDMDDYICYNF